MMKWIVLSCSWVRGSVVVTVLCLWTVVLTLVG